MKILIVHNAYQQRGGEDTVVEMERDMLAAAGHDVACEIVSNDAISGALAKGRAFLNAPHDAGRAVWMRELVTRTRADIVHIHNFFPLLTPAIHQGAAQAGAAVVQTLHNYRLLCANAMLLRQGAVCEKCIGGHQLWGVVHRCYRSSLPGSLSVVRMQMHAQRSGVWGRDVHRFIALTAFAKAKFIAGGLPADRISVRPNAVLKEPPPRGARTGALFVGRLAQEKGVATLIEAWKEMPDTSLRILGEGPERAALERMAPSNVIFEGRRSSSEVAAAMSSAAALIAPSIWYEGFPMIVAEAFAAGLPVLASNIGALAEIITPGRTGAHFAPGDAPDLARCVREAFAAPERLAAMGVAARAEYEAKFTPTAALASLEQIYDDALRTASDDQALRSARGRKADARP